MGATAAAQPAPLVATRARAAGARCTLSAPEELGTTTARGIAVQVAFGAAGRGLVAWSADGDHLATRSIDGASMSATRVEPFARAHDLSLLAGVRDAFLAVNATLLCDAQGQACFQARGLRADGRATGPALEERPGDQLPVIEASVPASDGVWVAQNWRWGPGRVARYVLGADGRVTVQAHASAQAGASGFAFAALAPAGARLWALTQAELVPRALHVLPDGGRHEVRGLPAEIHVESFVVDGDAAWLVFRVGATRPRIARISADGTFTERPRMLGADPLPSALADLVRPVIGVRGARITLGRVDAAGRPIGEASEISTTRATQVETAVAWSGRDFAVAYALRSREGWRVWLRRAACQ